MAAAYRRLYIQDQPERPIARLTKRLLRLTVPDKWLMWKGHRSRQVVALTFDDGPDANYTPRILEILGRYEATATFFLIGEKAARNNELVKQILREGHEIANHSYTHPPFDRLSLKQALEEVDRTQVVLQAIQGRSCRLFRPPKGRLCLVTLIGAWIRRMTIVMWSVDLKDYRANQTDEIAERLTETPIEPGDIVLYHGHNPAALAALPQVLEAALTGGRRAVSVSVMLRA
jgi:peptidoglycan/xylan/chitin deacetylase (PgdA/CDA1 family)